MPAKRGREVTSVFRPRARLMLLLGDELLRDAGIAVFELVKNAYDADARHCTLTLDHVDRDSEEASVSIRDDGCGMDLETVLNVWLEPGTEFRKDQRQAGERSPKFGRLPMGEKGVGRFAVHKLGREVRMTTRSRGSKEVVVSIDWSDFEAAEYLSEVPVVVRDRAPKVFTGRSTGTLIVVRDLRDKPWSRRTVRKLYRSTASICSPFRGPRSFSPRLSMTPDDTWLAGLLTANQVLDQAPFRFTGTIRGKSLTYDYDFVPGKGLGIRGRRVRKRTVPVVVESRDPETGRKLKRGIDLRRERIGAVRLEFRVFDRESRTLKLTATDPAGIRGYLDSNGGVRVYRDGVRVYDFGEPGNDWLDLGGLRVNVPARRIGNNQILGSVHLSARSSGGLVEKTNREGFVENQAYTDLREAAGFAVAQAAAERNKDKGRIRLVSSKVRKEPVLADLGMLRAGMAGRKPYRDLLPYLDSIEAQYLEVRNRLLVAAGAGLNMAAVMHEVDKGIVELHRALKKRERGPRVLALAKQLADMVEGLNWLTKKSGVSAVEAGKLIGQSIFNWGSRYKRHGITVTNGLDRGDKDFSAKCSRRLIMAALMNLIDNSIYWLEGNERGRSRRRLHLGTTCELSGAHAIVVADNGPGFSDPPEYLVAPFFTRKADGMGLGLHIADEVMKSQGGGLLFPGRGRVSLPRGLTGAIVALDFGSAE